MKEEMQDKLVEIMTSIQAAVGKAADFAVEQLPDIAQSYIMYGIAWNTAALIILAALSALSCVMIYRGVLAFKRDEYSYSGTVLVLLGGFGAATFGGLFVAQLQTTLLVWFAPKVWLIKELATLIK